MIAHLTHGTVTFNAGFHWEGERYCNMPGSSLQLV